MLKFLLGQLRFRGGRALALASGILVAAVSFVLLTSAVTTSELQVRGTVDENFRPAYDILVRPADSFTELEREQRLVRANYLSGMFGGIGFGQYEAVKELPGVEVAAPIANLGYVLPWEELTVRINDVLDEDPVQLYRLKKEWKAEAGLSKYPDRTTYVYYTRQNPFVSLAIGQGGGLVKEPWGYGEPYELVPGEEEPSPVCTAFLYDESGFPLHTQDSPFDRDDPYLTCFSELTPESSRRYFRDGVSDGTVGTFSGISVPMLLAAVDPEQESKLLGLDETVVRGRYLEQGESFGRVTDGSSDIRQVPVLASTETYLDSALEVSVERLRVPQGTDVPEILSDPDRVDDFLPNLSGEEVKRMRLESRPFYDEMLQTLSSDSRETFSDHIVAYWSSRPVRYEPKENGSVSPRPTTNLREIWDVPLYAGEYPAPPGNEDVQFREVMLNPGNNTITGGGPDGGGLIGMASVHVVGRFDPERLPGFSPLSEVPLETYYPPVAEPADQEAERALGGEPLRPSMNLGGYLSQPPLMLTTLEAAQAFTDPAAYGGANHRAPVSVIRVRVADVEGADPASLERIRRVADEIVEETGLAVDITAGSSPTPMTVELPAGDYGRPELTLQEGWVKKGVAVAIVEGVDQKSAALFGLVLVVCGFFLANGAFASVRARRKEFGVLLSLGWSRGKILGSVLGELALIGLLAGTLGAALAAVVAAALSLELPPERTLLVAPVSVLLAVLAGLVPAVAAARGEPMDAIHSPAKPPRSGTPVRSLAAMAARNLRRLPGRTLLGVIGLAMGVGALTVLLGINLAFGEILEGNLLGEAIGVQVRPVDYLSVALAVGLGGLSVADVIYLNLRERAPELVTLRASGWGEGHLVLLGMFEGIGLGLIGGVLGAVAGVSVAVLIGGTLSPTLVGLAVLTMLGSVMVALLASLVPVISLSRLTPPGVLAEE